jgi:hypothetical protein
MYLYFQYFNFLVYSFQFEDGKTGNIGHNYYTEANYNGGEDFDFNHGRGFPANHSALYQDNVEEVLSAVGKI